MERNSALSVTQLNSYIKMLLENDSFLGEVTIKGELSNFKRHTTGHVYFTLKDNKSEIGGVMFRSSADKLTFAPTNGMSVTVFGRISVYEPSGRYQLYANAMVKDGAGTLYEQYLRLKAKLEEEGLFDPQKKRPIPPFPRKIGIITSPTGAAVRDMINVTGRRYPSAEILICPALVQGAEAPAELCRALNIMNAMGNCDLLIIGRGGGSAEDLWAFNDENLVRAVAASATPIISAVGHETDTTLCDFAADMRAPTPSAAAEIAVPDKNTLLQSVDKLEEKLYGQVERLIGSYRDRVENASLRVKAGSPDRRLEGMRASVDNYRKLLDNGVRATYNNKKLRLSAAVGRLESVNPMAVIGRGYGMALDENGDVVGSVDRVEIGDKISLMLRDGRISAEVTGKMRKDI